MNIDETLSAEVVLPDRWRRWERSVISSAGTPAPESWRDVLPARRREGLEVEAVYPMERTDREPIPKESIGWESWLELPASRPVEVLGRLAALADWPLRGVRLNPAKDGGVWSIEDFSDLMATWPATLSLGLGNGFLRSFEGEASELVDLVAERLSSLEATDRQVHLGFAPLSGALDAPSENETPSLESWSPARVAQLRKHSVMVPFEVDTSVAAERGADAALEIAFALAMGAAYGRALMAAGWTPDEARDGIRLTVCLGRDVAIQIAKVRALRSSWGMLWTGLGAKPRHGVCHGRTAWRTQTLYDIENNQIRATLEALAGAVGGCSSLSILRFDEARSVGGEFSSAAARLTMATQSILAEECGLQRVQDAASGSAYLETLTEQIARRAWHIFRSLEGQGGAESQRGINSLRTRLQEAAAARREALASGQLPVVGVSAFPAESETLAQDLADVDLAGDLGSGSTLRWRDSGAMEEERRATSDHPRGVGS